MNDKINNIDDIQSWEDIEKHIKILYTDPQNDFIILHKNEDKYILMSDEDIKNINCGYECFLLPNYVLKNIDCHTSPFAFTGFNAHPRYEVITYLYDYRNNTSMYKLLWFTSAIHHIVQNYQYNRFDGCINYNKAFVENVLEHLLKICGNEINIKLNMSDYRYIFGNATKNFLPDESISYCYEHINKSLDISDINIIIDYISLIIQEIKSNYRLIVVYRDTY